MQSLKQARVSHESVKGRELKQYIRFAQTILEQANINFSVMHHKIFKKAWNNNITAYLPRNQVYTNWTQGEYEFYYPTQKRSDVDCLQFGRVIIKVQNEIDRQTIDKQLIDLQRPRLKPLGFIDSELIVFVARHRSKKAAQEKQTWRYGGRLRGFRHIKKKGFLTAIIIDRNPYRAMKRLLTIIASFYRKRLNGFLKSLNLQPWQYDYTKLMRLYYMSPHIIEQYSHSLATTLKVFSRSLEWILKCRERTKKAIGRQNEVIDAYRKGSKLLKKIQTFKIDRSEIGSRLTPETETVLNLLEELSETEKRLKHSLKPNSMLVKVPIRVSLKPRYTCGG